MEAKQCYSLITKYYEEALTELFSSFGCEVVKCNQEVSNLTSEPLARIDAGTFDLEVILILNVPMTVLSLTYPVSGEIINIDDEALEDWLLELSNLLIGKVKSKLINHNCILQLGLPDAIFGGHLSSYQESSYDTTRVNLEVDGELIVTYIGVDFLCEHISFDEAKGESTYVEGDLELF
ncbi:hypothetical protein [Pleionea sp. CnH1-48]|uniref:hypothetical protein n=1 Tax=Pleionea sp. CnH1-48 TaxID=2954494 RepID=UPI002096AB4A|nr:hypothetical protein [Pleionea sp. CnH1-48]MCO7225285.1 hypothetical protein [Pleionea sp. CnH1-48]